jgi:hypothetical protein
MLSARSHEANVYPSLNEDCDLKEFVDELKEFAVTNLYIPRGRKWGKYWIFTVEKFEENKESYIDLDLFYMTADELNERDRKLNKTT